MLNQKIELSLNEQLNAELYSSYLYLSMAAYYESKDLPGFAHWFRVQAQEELYHSMKFLDYINERGGRVNLKGIEGPQTEWSSIEAPLEQAYEHEVMVSGLINDLVNLAIEEKDHATNNFLQWFVKEQVEEEASSSGQVQKVKLAGTEGNGIFMLDRENAQRLPLFTFPTPGSKGGD